MQHQSIGHRMRRTHKHPCRSLARWCWEVTGLANMGRRGGVPNMTWAWRVALFTLPLPFSSRRRRLIVELGPATSFSIVLWVLSIALRSWRLYGLGMLWNVICVAMVRWLSGTLEVAPIAFFLALSAPLFW